DDRWSLLDRPGAGAGTALRARRRANLLLRSPQAMSARRFRDPPQTLADRRMQPLQARAWFPGADGQGTMDSVRPIWVLLPWRSCPETVRRPLASWAMGFCKRSFQRLSGKAWSFPARFSPGRTPSIAKSAVTDRLFRSRPVP